MVSHKGKLNSNKKSQREKKLIEKKIIKSKQYLLRIIKEKPNQIPNKSFWQLFAYPAFPNSETLYSENHNQHKRRNLKTRQFFLTILELIYNRTNGVFFSAKKMLPSYKVHLKNC